MNNSYNQPQMHFNANGQFGQQQQQQQQPNAYINNAGSNMNYQQQAYQQASPSPYGQTQEPYQQPVYHNQQQHQQMPQQQYQNQHQSRNQYQPQQQHPLQQGPPPVPNGNAYAGANLGGGANNQASSSYTMTRPPYVDPETQIVYPVTTPSFEGYLTKQSVWLKDWRRRYFLLCGSKLFFCKNPYGTPHGMIDLSTATTVKSADIKSQKKNSFEISTNEMTFLMFADDEKSKDDWIGNVGRAIVRASGTYLQKNEVEDENNDDDGDDDEGVFENSENHPYFND